jgi:formate hydrogenlyase transcriptional activator
MSSSPSALPRHSSAQNSDSHLAAPGEIASYLPIEGAEGVVRVAAVLRDVTEQTRAREAIQASEQRLSLALESAEMGFWEHDHASNTTTRNLRHDQIFGHESALPEWTREIFLDHIVPEDREAVQKVMGGDWTHKSFSEECRILWPDRSLHWILTRGRTFEDETGQVVKTLGTVMDITESKRAEQALRESEERLRLSQEAAHIGTFDRNLLTGENRWTPQMGRVYGLPPGASPPTSEEFLQLLHPDDRSRVSELLGRSLESGEAGGEWRTVWPDGSTHWISGRWRIIRDACGTPVRLIGSDYDITDRKRIEEELRADEERFRLFIENAPAGLAMFDREMRYLHVSRRWRTDFHLGERDLRGLSHYDVFPDIPEHWKEAHRRGLAGEVVREEADRYDRADGSVYWLCWEIRPWHDKSGAVGGIVIFAEDITERKGIEEELREAKEKLTEEKLYLEQEIDSQFGFEEIIGQSQALKTVMESVSKVAACDAAVLLLGETGTGKELMARAIHRLSRRSGNAFIKMNCAAIPSGLLESELFGNEKGAFTGAVSKKIGRLELADKGSIFLDEIGEISLALQPKLLRVLQDQEFERLGGTQTLKIDFRLIAATNRDLAKSVRDKEFRSDLFYRLNVFPIYIPPLRERREDIPLLVEHFVQKISRRMKKTITSVPKKTMDALMRWSWPGNVRELENFLERSLILTTGSTLAAPLGELQHVPANGSVGEQTLEAAERRHIINALHDCSGRISGPRGAAIRLGLKRTTLQSRLKQLGINPRVPPPSR